MEWSFALTFAVVMLNLTIILFNIQEQRREIAENKIPDYDTIIPGTKQKFLHWEDFYTQQFGDAIFLSAMFVTFWHLCVFTDHIKWWEVVLGIILFLFLSKRWSKFHKGNKLHKPDWGYPKVGEESEAGGTHALYFGFSLTVFLDCLIHLVLGHIPLYSWAFWSFVGGITGYLICFIADIRAGNFEPLKLIETEE